MWLRERLPDAREPRRIRHESRPAFGWSAPLARLAAVFAAAILLLGGTMVASASSLPEEPLYPLKLAVEGAQLALVPDPQARSELELQFAARRLEEVESAARQGKAEAIARGLALYEEKVESALRAARLAPEPIEEGKAQQLSDSLERHQEVLARVYNRVPEQARPAIAHAIEVSKRDQTRPARGGTGIDAREPAATVAASIAPTTTAAVGAQGPGGGGSGIPPLPAREDRGEGPGVGGRGPEERGLGPAVGGRGPEDRGQRPEDRSQWPEDRSQAPEDRGRGPEADRGRGPEGRDQGPEDRGRGAGGREPGAGTGERGPETRGDSTALPRPSIGASQEPPRAPTRATENPSLPLGEGRGEGRPSTLSPRNPATPATMGSTAAPTPRPTGTATTQPRATPTPGRDRRERGEEREPNPTPETSATRMPDRAKDDKEKDDPPKKPSNTGPDRGMVGERANR